MKTRISMRAALALGLSAVARSFGRARRWRHAALSCAGHEAGKENVVSAFDLSCSTL